MKLNKYDWNEIQKNLKVTKTKDGNYIILTWASGETSYNIVDMPPVLPPKWFQEFLSMYKQDMSEVKQRLDVIETDIKAIKNCPTIKKELGLSNIR